MGILTKYLPSTLNLTRRYCEKMNVFCFWPVNYPWWWYLSNNLQSSWSRVLINSFCQQKAYTRVNNRMVSKHIWPFMEPLHLFAKTIKAKRRKREKKNQNAAKISEKERMKNFATKLQWTYIWAEVHELKSCAYNIWRLVPILIFNLAFWPSSSRDISYQRKIWKPIRSRQSEWIMYLLTLTFHTALSSGKCLYKHEVLELVEKNISTIIWKAKLSGKL